MQKKQFLLYFILSLHAIPIVAQDYASFYEKSLSQNSNGMIVLGSWAISNMALGAYGWKSNTDANRYFHQMNFFWNSLNLSIAGFGLYSNITTDVSTLTHELMMDKHQTMEKILLINSGLDVLYMSTGYWLTQRSKKVSKRVSMLKGYGNSLILQGGFLFVFDLAFYGLKHHHRRDFLDSIELSQNGLGMVFTF